jgi:hypothetical protein
MGAWSKVVPKRVAEYCDGWIPLDAGFELVKLGFHRVLFIVSTARPEGQWPELERYAALIRKFN